MASTALREGAEERKLAEVLSESEDGGDHEPETAEEDAFMFKKMGRKVRDKFRRFTETYLSNKGDQDKKGEKSSAALPLQVQSFDDASMLLWSAFRIPVYDLERDEYSRKGLPMILGLLKVRSDLCFLYCLFF